jgi:hypothetical protein
MLGYLRNSLAFGGDDDRDLLPDQIRRVRRQAIVLARAFITVALVCRSLRPASDKSETAQ